MTNTKDRICQILRATERPGIEAVINYLLTSSYFKRGCYGHHKEYGGLAQHSLEVYEHMLSHTNGYAADSIAAGAFFMTWARRLGTMAVVTAVGPLISLTAWDSHCRKRSAPLSDDIMTGPLTF